MSPAEGGGLLRLGDHRERPRRGAAPRSRGVRRLARASRAETGVSRRLCATRPLRRDDPLEEAFDWIKKSPNNLLPSASAGPASEPVDGDHRLRLAPHHAGLEVEEYPLPAQGGAVLDDLGVSAQRHEVPRSTRSRAARPGAPVPRLRLHRPRGLERAEEGVPRERDSDRPRAGDRQVPVDDGRSPRRVTPPASRERGRGHDDLAPALGGQAQPAAAGRGRKGRREHGGPSVSCASSDPFFRAFPRSRDGQQHLERARGARIASTPAPAKTRRPPARDIHRARGEATQRPVERAAAGADERNLVHDERREPHRMRAGDRGLENDPPRGARSAGPSRSPEGLPVASTTRSARGSRRASPTRPVSAPAAPARASFSGCFPSSVTGKPSDTKTIATRMPSRRPRAPPSPPPSRGPPGSAPARRPRAARRRPPPGPRRPRAPGGGSRPAKRGDRRTPRRAPVSRGRFASAVLPGRGDTAGRNRRGS